MSSTTSKFSLDYKGIQPGMTLTYENEVNLKQTKRHLRRVTLVWITKAFNLE